MAELKSPLRGFGGTVGTVFSTAPICLSINLCFLSLSRASSSSSLPAYMSQKVECGKLPAYMSPKVECGKLQNPMYLHGTFRLPSSLKRTSTAASSSLPSSTSSSSCNKTFQRSKFPITSCTTSNNSTITPQSLLPGRLAATAP